MLSSFIIFNAILSTLSTIKFISRRKAIHMIYLFGVLHRFQDFTGHIMTGSWKGRGNQYIQFIRILYCKLPTNGKQLPAFSLEAVLGTEPRPQRWEVKVLSLCHHEPGNPYEVILVLYLWPMHLVWQLEIQTHIGKKTWWSSQGHEI